MNQYAIGDCLPAFSIVTPSFNQGEYLEMTLRSVLEQDYPTDKIQYIVMDGGSRDQSVDIIKQYNGNLSYWQSKADGGQANAINKGFEMADGDVVAWLNSDDIYLPGVLAEVAALFSDPLVQATSANAYHWETKNKQLYLAKGAPPQSWLLRCYGNYIAQPTCFWRKDIWREFCGLKTHLHRYLDYEFQLRLLQAGVRYKYIDVERSIILWHGENKCATMNLADEWQELADEYDLLSHGVRRSFGKSAWIAMQLYAGNHAWVYSSIMQRIRQAGRPGLLGLKIGQRTAEETLGHRLFKALSDLSQDGKNS